MAKKTANITAVDITVVVSLVASFLVGHVVSFMVLKTLLINFTESPPYRVSRCKVCLLQYLQNFLTSSRSCLAGLAAIV